jgi:hypothetical protein
MKHKKIIIISFFLNILFLVSCNNKIEKESSLEKGFKQHEVVMNGKRISFILPEYYISTEECYRRARIASSGCDIDTLIIFCSRKNSLDNFGIVISSSEYKESEIDSFFKTDFYFHIAQDMVPFYEKKRDENNHVFYLVMASKIEKFPPNEPYIFSKFKYITIFQDKYYVCELSTSELVGNKFSYEEKRKIIESVRIEEIGNAWPANKSVKSKERVLYDVMLFGKGKIYCVYYQDLYKG